MSPSSAAEMENAAREMNIYGNGSDSYQIPQSPGAGSNRFKQVKSTSPRTSKVLKFFSNIRNLVNFAIAWVKEIPQKIAIHEFKTIERNAERAVKAAVATNVFEKQIGNISKFLECAVQLSNINTETSKVPKAVRDSCFESLGRLVPEHFDNLDCILRSLDDTCNFHCAEVEVSSKCRPLRDFLKIFIKEHATSEQHQLIEIRLRYLEN